MPLTINPKLLQNKHKYLVTPRPFLVFHVALVPLAGHRYFGVYSLGPLGETQY